MKALLSTFLFLSAVVLAAVADVPSVEQKLESSLKLDQPLPAPVPKLPPGMRTRGFNAGAAPAKVVQRRGFRLRGGELPDDASPVVVNPNAGQPAQKPGLLTEKAAEKAKIEPVTTPAVADSEARLDDVLFVFNSTAFAHPAQAEESLQHLANVLQRHPDAKLLIEGHTCDLGEERYNLVLSCYRANAVAAYLSKTLHIPADHLIPTGFGAIDPVEHVEPGDSKNEAEAKRTANRRARLRLAAP